MFPPTLLDVFPRVWLRSVAGPFAGGPKDWRGEVRTASARPTNGFAIRRDPGRLGFHVPSAQVKAASSSHIRSSKIKLPIRSDGEFYFGASDEARTRYLHLGKVALYQMSYTRNDKRYYSFPLPFCQGLFSDSSPFSAFSGAVSAADSEGELSSPLAAGARLSSRPSRQMG